MDEQFYDACTAGDLPTVERCIEDEDVDLGRGLFLAAQAGHSQLVAHLLSRGVGEDSEALATALYLASQNGHTEVVRFLLEQNAPVDAPVYFGRRALHAAATHGEGGSISCWRQAQRATCARTTARRRWRRPC